MPRSLPMLALALLFAAPSHAEVPTEAEAQALCDSVAGFQPSEAARASDDDRRRFAGKTAGNCWAFLYVVPAAEREPEAARRCCLATGDCNRELAILFANGWGVPRDYDAATHFLCRAGNEMAAFEQRGMLAHVQRMRGEAEPPDLDYCDHVTSGHGGLLCAQLATERQVPEWDRRIEAVGAALDGPGRDALGRLLAAAETFTDEEGGYREDGARGGTGYASFVVAAQRKAYEAFVATLERYGRERAPRADAALLRKADRGLNAAYRKALTAASEPCPLCREDDHESGRAALRDAQRAWIAYRDAWAAWYRKRWTSAAPEAALEREITAALTATRTKELLQEPE